MAAGTFPSKAPRKGANVANNNPLRSPDNAIGANNTGATKPLRSRIIDSEAMGAMAAGKDSTQASVKRPNNRRTLSPVDAQVKSVPSDDKDAGKASPLPPSRRQGPRAYLGVD